METWFMVLFDIIFIVVFAYCANRWGLVGMVERLNAGSQVVFHRVMYGPRKPEPEPKPEPTPLHALADDLTVSIEDLVAAAERVANNLPVKEIVSACTGCDQEGTYLRNVYGVVVRHVHERTLGERPGWHKYEGTHTWTRRDA